MGLPDIGHRSVHDTGISDDSRETTSTLYQFPPLLLTRSREEKNSSPDKNRGANLDRNIRRGFTIREIETTLFLTSRSSHKLETMRTIS